MAMALDVLKAGQEALKGGQIGGAAEASTATSEAVDESPRGKILQFNHDYANYGQKKEETKNPLIPIEGNGNLKISDAKPLAQATTGDGEGGGEGSLLQHKHLQKGVVLQKMAKRKLSSLPTFGGISLLLIIIGIIVVAIQPVKGKGSNTRLSLMWQTLLGKWTVAPGDNSGNDQSITNSINTGIKVDQTANDITSSISGYVFQTNPLLNLGIQGISGIENDVTGWIQNQLGWS